MKMGGIFRTTCVLAFLVLVTLLCPVLLLTQDQEQTKQKIKGEKVDKVGYDKTIPAFINSIASRSVETASNELKSRRADQPQDDSDQARQKSKTNKTDQPSWCQSSCRTMETSVSALGLAISSVSSAMETTSSAVRAAEGKVVVLETKMASIEKELRAKYEKCETNLQVLERLVEANFSSFKASRMKVGFTVKFSSDPVSNFGNNAIYQFDYVVTNVGNGYNPQTGIFTASTSGLYAFHLNLMSTNNNGASHFAIEKNGMVVGNVFAEGSTDNYDQGSITVVVYMEQGQQTWVRHKEGSTVIRGGDWTVFTGFLVQA